MQELMDQLVTAFAGLSVSARWSLLASAGVVGLLGLLVGLMFRRKPEHVETMQPGLLGSCGAATFRCRVVPDLRFTELSSDIETVTGYSAEVLTQDDAFLRMLEEADAHQLESRARKAVQDEHPMVADLRYFDADGRLRWMQFRAEPSVDPKGRSRGLVGILREITEQKRLAAEATSAWARYHALAEATPTMLWLIDESLNCHATNSASERFAGVAEDQLMGESWLDTFAADQREAVEKYLNRQLDESSAAQRDTVMIDAHGRNRNVVIRATVVRDESSGERHIVLVGRDVTDRSEGEKQLDRMRRLVDASEPSTMILAPDMRVTMLNPTGRALIGLGERQAADSLALWHIVTKDTVDEIRAEGVKACAEGGLWKGTGQLRCSEDESITAQITVIALGDGWHGLIAREIEGELRREADAALDRRRLTVALGAIERLSGGGWAPGRSTERIVESISRHYPELRASYASFGDDGSIIVEASDGPAWMGSAKGRITTIDSDGSFFQKLRANEILKVADVWEEPELSRGVLGLEETMARSMAMVLVDSGDHSMGLMLFERPDVYQWTSDETQTLRMASTLLGVAMRAERDRRSRLAAEARAAEQTNRWREERDRAEELARLASDRVTETERLSAQLARIDSAWASGMVELGRRTVGAADLAIEAREAGLNALADRLEQLSMEADRAEISGRIVSGSLKPEFEPCDPSEMLKQVGQRFAGPAQAKGVSLLISQEGALPEAITTDVRLYSLACSELLSLALARCSAREMRVVAEVTGRMPDEALVLRVVGGPISTPDHHPSGAPEGLALLKQIAEALHGTMQVKTEASGTTLALSIPTVQDQDLKLDQAPEGDQERAA